MGKPLAAALPTTTPVVVGNAIHIASALEAECTEVLSWDGGMQSPKKVAKVQALAALGVRVIVPSQTQLLPSFYMAERISMFPPPN